MMTTIRTARPDDAAAIHALIESNRERGHLLPRRVGEIAARIGTARSFYVAELGADSAGRVVACGEVARLSRSVAEVRSLVVDEAWRGKGVAGRLVAALHHRAALEGHDRLCAFAHDPVPFMRLGFSLVPHAWLPEKISADCAGCALFRACGQYALLLRVTASNTLRWQRQSDAA